MDILKKITEELGVQRWQTEAAVKLIDEGNTIPFISRYRKEATGSLNDEILRNLNERLTYLRNLEEKKEQVLGSIREQGKLKEELERIFVQNEEYNSLMVTILSFGFKHGIPADADLVFDVRFLPNPFYIDELKYKTGNDKEVQDYVMGFPEASVFIDKLADMVEFLIPNYIKEGKYQLVIGIGCTGGKHRSVTLANHLYMRMKNKGSYGLKIDHRDVGQGTP